MLVGAEVRGLRSFYEPGYQLTKAGVMLLDLGPAGVEQWGLLDEGEIAGSMTGKEQGRLMEAVDRINNRLGKGSVHVGSTGFASQDEAGWRMRQERRTPRHTNRIDEIPLVRA